MTGDDIRALLDALGVSLFASLAVYLSLRAVFGWRSRDHSHSVYPLSKDAESPAEFDVNSTLFDTQLAFDRYVEQMTTNALIAWVVAVLFIGLIR